MTSVMQWEVTCESADGSRRVYSTLAACTGCLFSCRTIFVLITARWLNIGTEAGILAGFALSLMLLIATSLAAFGNRAHSCKGLVETRTFQWVTLYLAFAGCSLLWSASASPAASAVYWCGLVLDVGMVVLLCRADGGECAATSLMQGFITGTCVLSAVAWMMPAEEDLRLGDMEFFNTNQIGNLCALAVLMCAYLGSRGDRRWRAAALFLGITLLRSLSKSTLVAFLVCQAYRLIRDTGMSTRRKWLMTIGAVVITFIFWGLLDAYYGVYTDAGNQAETLTGRTAIWAWGFDAALSRPWFGNGFDAMWKVAPPFGGELFEARHAENELLQQFFAYGVWGIAMLVGVYGSLYRRIRVLPRGSERSILASFLVYVVVRGFAEAEPFDLLLPLWLITALTLLIRQHENGAERAEEKPNLLGGESVAGY